MLFSFVLLVGGGSGNSVADALFEGTWRVFLTTLENTCGEGFNTDNLEVELQVAQDGDNITVTSSFGNVFTGSVTGPDSFTVSRSFSDNCVGENDEILPESFFDADTFYTFSGVSGNTATVEFREDSGNCSGNIGTTEFDASCFFVEQGPGERIS